MEARSLTRPGTFVPRSRRLLAALGDDRLVEQLRRGNVAAFEAIYDRHHAGLLSFCRHMLGSREEAEDALQQVFVAAYDGLRRDQRPVAVKPWLYTVARNRCLTLLRARREQPGDPPEVPTAGLSEQVETRAELKELLADLAELPEQQRAALVLFELGDLSHPEVANVLGVEGQKVKALVFQARTALTEMRNARAIPCVEIREQLATARGGVLRRGPLRRHLRHCPGCSAFGAEVRAQRAALAVILPVVPTLGLRDSALAAAGLAGGGGGAAGGGGLIAGLAAKGATVKVAAATIATTAAIGGGAAVTNPPAFLGGDDAPEAAATAPRAPAAASATMLSAPGAAASTAAAMVAALAHADALVAEEPAADQERREKRAAKASARAGARGKRRAHGRGGTDHARRGGTRGRGHGRGTGHARGRGTGAERRADGGGAKARVPSVKPDPGRGAGTGGGRPVEVVPPVPVDPPAKGQGTPKVEQDAAASAGDAG